MCSRISRVTCLKLLRTSLAHYEVAAYSSPGGSFFNIVLSFVSLKAAFTGQRTNTLRLRSKERWTPAQIVFDAVILVCWANVRESVSKLTRSARYTPWSAKLCKYNVKISVAKGMGQIFYLYYDRNASQQVDWTCSSNCFHHIPCGAHLYKFIHLLITITRFSVDFEVSIIWTKYENERRHKLLL